MELERENAFYDAHQAEFREKYMDKWLVISGDSLWGVYDKFADAAQAAMEQLGSNEFMVHRPSDDGKIVEIGPRLHFRRPNDTEEPKMYPEMVCSGDNPVMFTYPY